MIVHCMLTVSLGKPRILQRERNKEVELPPCIYVNYMLHIPSLQAKGYHDIWCLLMSSDDVGQALEVTNFERRILLEGRF